MQKFNIATNLWELVEDEGEANKGYAEFLTKYSTCLTPEAAKLIEDIMSEEIKHINILMKMAEDLTGIKAEED